MRQRIWTTFIATFVILTIGISPSTAQKRFALVIGNSTYSKDLGGPLTNPGNDANLVSEALQRLGFSVQTLKDGTRSTMLREIETYGRKLSDAGIEAVGFFYYSGHGVSRPLDGTNYLIPVDVRSLQTESAWYDTISLESVTKNLQTRAPNASHFFVFDACRSELRLPNKSPSKGFDFIPQQNGLFIALSTSPNQTASDIGTGGGPYARALASELGRPGQDHLALFQNVKEQVFAATGFVQRPWENNGLLKRVYLNNAAKLPVPTATQSQPLAALPSFSITGKKETSCDDLKALIGLSQQLFAPLRTGQQDASTWNTNAKLHGFNRCSIKRQNDGDVEFSCNGPELTSRDVVKKSNGESIAAASACLGEGWMKNPLFDDAVGISNLSSNVTIIYGIFQGVDVSNPKPSGAFAPTFYQNVRIYMTGQRKSTEQATISPPAKPSNYCDNLLKVVKSADQLFDGISRRTPVAKARTRSSIQLDGWDDCVVFQQDETRESRFYTCSLEPFSIEQARSTAQDITGDLKACLGNDWVGKRRRGYQNEITTEYYSDVDPSVEIRLSKNYDETWEIKLDVNANKSR